MLIFADEQIGTSHYQLAMRACLNGAGTTSAQGQITISGYLEDLPTTP